MWESALETSHSLFSRLAIIHLVHEARGLDTNPRQIARAKSAGDKDSAAMLQIMSVEVLPSAWLLSVLMRRFLQS